MTPKDRDDSFIIHEGCTEPSIDPNTKVMVYYRNGASSIAEIKAFHWINNGGLADIVKYKVVEPCHSSVKASEFIEHSGECRPVKAGTLVAVYRRDGVVDTALAGRISWVHDKTVNDVMSYKVLKDVEIKGYIANDPEKVEIGSVPDIDLDIWYKSNGVFPSLSASRLLRVRHRNNAISDGVAENFKWSHDGIPGDIVEYRLLDAKPINPVIMSIPDNPPPMPKVKPAKPNTQNVRDFNVGDSDYASHKIQPWDIWFDWDLNPWDADIIKRTLRSKKGDSRKLDYQKIIHVCQERIRQIDEEVKQKD